MKIKVSVIVPVYNTEKYLNKCLNSLVNQSLKEIEIILVNDCSTDNSLTILNDYKNKYPEKITVINLKENKGPGGARNEGISVANGEYLGFVDSDDDVSVKMFEELYKIAFETDSDIVDCKYYNESLNENILTTDKSALGDLTLEKRRELFIHAGFIFSKIIKRDIIINNNIKFREKVAYEDTDFIRTVIFYCKKISISDLILYYHRYNETSLTNQNDLNIQIYQKIDAVKFLVNKFKNLNAYDDYKEEIIYFIYKTYAVILYNIWSGNETVNLEVFKDLHDFFFELVDCDYHNNKYILNMSKEIRIAAEINNEDYTKLSSICME